MLSCFWSNQTIRCSSDSKAPHQVWTGILCHLWLYAQYSALHNTRRQSCPPIQKYDWRLFWQYACHVLQPITCFMLDLHPPYKHSSKRMYQYLLFMPKSLLSLCHGEFRKIENSSLKKWSRLKEGGPPVRHDPKKVLAVRYILRDTDSNVLSFALLPIQDPVDVQYFF